MGTYKGNQGNLMQHWTLCEVLSIANRHHSALNYIDAHAMAPLATKRTDCDVVFDRVRDNLAKGNSVYEKAWFELASTPSDGYPNSANFVTKVWERHFSLLLCEIRETTANEIDQWLNDVRFLRGYCHTELSRDDWRARFQVGLPQPANAGLPGDALTYISFDPNMYDRNGPPERPKAENMYPPSLDTVLKAAKDIKAGILVQLSTYNANNDNSQRDVIPHIDGRMSGGDFERVAKTRVDGNMMSLIYARNVDWTKELATLGSRFTEWLNSV